MREGGSLPAIVEADDEGLYVLKFRGAGQGPKALVAELAAGEIGRLAGLPIPEIVFMTLPHDLARTEPDAEIQSLIDASAGLNLALDYLPGSVTFDPLTYQPDANLASAIVWFDAFICNVDRTARNVNMLMWHRKLWLIDHGAALYFQHAWNQRDRHALTPFPLIKDHVLLKYASRLEEADVEMKARISADAVERIVAAIPEEWLAEDSGFDDKRAQRNAYLNFFKTRLESSSIFPCRRLFVPAPRTYDYAVVRVVPRVERGEFLNAGIILSCDLERILLAGIELDERALLALDANADLDLIRHALASIPRICAGGETAGDIGKMSPRERFHWLVAPRSTIVQTSPVHTGQCADPAAALDHLLQTMVRR